MDKQVYETVAAEVFDRDTERGIDVDALGAVLLAEYDQAVSDRRPTEERWIEDLRQFKGQYSSDELGNMAGASRVFVRKTRAKVKTIDARVADMLFPPGGQRNWDVQPSPVPELSGIQQQAVQAQIKALQQQGVEIDKLTLDKLVLDAAKKAATAMETLIADQLAEAGYVREAKLAMHQCHVYGTGIIKGPMVKRKVRTVFKAKKGKFHPVRESFVTPIAEHVSIWNVFPDMSATELEDCRYVWQRHWMSAPDLAELAERPGFRDRAELIREYIKSNPEGHARINRSAESEIRDIGNRVGVRPRGHTYEVLERWGWLTGEQLKCIGVQVDEGREHESFFGFMWMLSTGEVLRVKLNEIDGTMWPYHFYYFDKDESSIFGEGVASIMRDDQKMINASTRLLLDNAALSAGPMFEVTPSLLSASEHTSMQDIRAWRVWLRNNAHPGQRAVVPVGIDGRLGDLQGIKNMFENSADETTAIPRYMTGENPTAGAAATASGMSMLMSAANIVVKDLISNWDEGITKPLIEAFYAWNMRYSKDPAIKGDYQVVATGTSSLVAKEVRTRQLNEFAAMTANPLDAPYIKRDALNRLRAQAHELSDVVKTEQEIEQEAQGAQEQAQAAQQMQMQMMQVQLAEATAKAQEIGARAELQQAKARETMANIELLMARKLDSTMEAIYAALQAAGITVQNPELAPVADEIIRDAGYVGQADLQEIAAQAGDVETTDTFTASGPNPATGHAGVRSGIQTQEPGDQ